MKQQFFSFLSLLIFGNIVYTSAQDIFDINLKPGARIPETLYGIFFEDINYGADGGLYAELIKNRSFEFPGNPFQGWKTFGNVSLKDDGPFENNPHYVCLNNPGHPHMWTGLENEGFFGIGIREGEDYRLSFWARTSSGDSSLLKVELINPSSFGSMTIVSAEIDVIGNQWKKYETILQPKTTFDKSRLRIIQLNKKTGVDLEHISLFPVETWKGRENGLRKDLVQALFDLHPGVFRFPGGCIVEGTNLASRYQWKNSVGPVENRPLNLNRWQFTFGDRLFPDYYQSYGLGFYEYFLLSEDLGAEPLPVLNCGLSCQYQNNSIDAHAKVDSLDEYIQDALDLIEFANGNENSKWGALRSRLGHPEPFNLKYIAIGNEQWDSIYIERLEPFIRAIRKQYPEINIVGSSGPHPNGGQFDYLWKEMKRLNVDLVDEHFYSPRNWFKSQGERYDNYDRKGPKVFAGEYACHDNGYKGRAVNHFHASLMEAAFMTTIERNADIVQMATYAPLFANINGWQWRPDLIWFDNLRVMRTSSWYVQQLYSTYKGSNVLSLTQNNNNVTGKDGLFASAVSDEDLIYIKIINTTEEIRNIEMNFKGLKKGQVLIGKECVRFTADDPNAENTIDDPLRVTPVKESLAMSGNLLTVSVEPLSFNIYVLQGCSDNSK